MDSQQAPKFKFFFYKRMSVYLHDIPLKEAQDRLNSALENADLNAVLDTEKIPLKIEALGRTLATSIWAKISSPQKHKAAMDGFAVRARETNGATQTAAIELQLSAHAVYVDTGRLIPDGFDAIVPIENVETISIDGQVVDRSSKSLSAIRIRAAVTPWAHVRPLGEDFVTTQLVLPVGHTLRPVDLGAIAASGHDHLMVARKPKVAIMPTGNELLEIGKPIQADGIIESNGLILASQVVRWGAEANLLPIVTDDFEELKKQVSLAIKEHDLILINAGSSAGSKDFTAKVIEELGTLLVHGVAVRPGHPVVIGMLPGENGNQIPVVGVPGYPVSATLTNEIFVEPIISRWLGRSPFNASIIDAELTQKITSPAGDDDFVRVVLAKVGGKMLAAPLKRGAGVLSSLVQADGLALLPSGVQGQLAGKKISVQLYSSEKQLDRNIFAIGSHDLALDILTQFLAPLNRNLKTASVGSIGGLNALKRGVTHLAGSHLFDAKTQEFNLPFIQEYLPKIEVKVIGLVERQQGLIVKKGNPKSITSIDDLTRSDIRFVNRQRGAGTKILIDYLMEKANIESAQVTGYQDEEFTHLSLAAAIAADRADCGLGIQAAAIALDLDFVPIFKERFDLVIPIHYFDSELLQPIWTIFEDKEFRKAIDEIPGYNSAPLGKQMSFEKKR
jgi:putative molybdopterin biosynthesis protein